MRPQGAGPRLQARARLAHAGDVRQPLLQRLQTLPVGGRAQSCGLAPPGRAFRRGAAFLELHAAPSDERQRARVSGLRLVERGFGSGDGRPQLLRLQQRVRGRGVGGLLAGGRFGQLCGHALDGAPVALQMLVEVAPSRAYLGKEASGALRVDARFTLGRARVLGGLARCCLSPDGERERSLLAELASRDGVELLRHPLERRAALEQQRGRHTAGEADLPFGGPVELTLPRHRQPRELGRYGAQVVDDDDVGQRALQALVLAEAHLVRERRGAREGDRRTPPGRDDEADQPDPGALERLEQRPLVDPSGHGERPRQLGQSGRESALVADLAGDAAGE